MFRIWNPLILQIIAICINGGSADLPRWVHRVSLCPDPSNISDWIKRSKELNCYHNLLSKEPTEQQKVYHCLPSSFLNETVEFCGRNVPVVQGNCPVYNYRVSQNIAPTYYNCTNFTSGCPNIDYYSKNVFMYPECLRINKRSKCYEAEFYCPNGSYSKIPSTVKSNESPGVIVILCITIPLALLIVIGILLVFNRKKISCCKKGMETNVTLELRKRSNETEEHEENASNRLLIENGTDEEFNEIRSTYEEYGDKLFNGKDKMESCGADDARTCVPLEPLSGTQKPEDIKGYDQKKTNDKVPGKPHASNIKSDSISLTWDKAGDELDNFQIRYKAENEDSRWKFFESYVRENKAVINGLMADTGYRFQVRGIYKDEEEPYGPISDVIKTRESLATTMLGSCGPSVSNSSPPIYFLPVQENIMSRNNDKRTRQLLLGNQVKDFYDEKTILLVGATGSGKSTLVDGIANYIMGVSFEDPFRFKMVNLEESEMKTNNQAHSQTDWITVYKIFPKFGSRLDYTLKIIDTPGFGDTRGIQRDEGIVDQIRHLFSEKGDRGVSFIDAVCFIVKAPDARLTIVQNYIFTSIMCLFGKDIASNICTLITFADGGDPPVLASLKESELPFGKTFHFNNSALFAENNDTNPLSSMFWEMGRKSFMRFFEHISHLETKSLCQTKNVLDEREQLKTMILGIRPIVTAGLSKLAELEEQLKTFQSNQNKIKENQNFEYTVEETKQSQEDLPVGKHVTNCLQCNLTCHEDCKIADDDRKMYCAAMDPKTKACNVCPDKCIWSMHKNTKYIFRYITEPVTKTYAEMKRRHEEAIGEIITHENYIEQLTNEIDEFWDAISKMMQEMNRCRERLNEIALRPDPMSSVEYIDLMIETEKRQKQSGYSKRIDMLEEMKKRARVNKDVEMLSRTIQDSKKSTKEVTGKSFDKKIDKSKKNIFSQLFGRNSNEKR